MTIMPDAPDFYMVGWDAPTLNEVIRCWTIRKLGVRYAGSTRNNCLLLKLSPALQDNVLHTGIDNLPTIPDVDVVIAMPSDAIEGFFPILEWPVRVRILAPTVLIESHDFFQEDEYLALYEYDLYPSKEAALDPAKYRQELDYPQPQTSRHRLFNLIRWLGKIIGRL